jgi:hypothetical protein
MRWDLRARAPLSDPSVPASPRVVRGGHCALDHANDVGTSGWRQLLLNGTSPARAHRKASALIYQIERILPAQACHSALKCRQYRGVELKRSLDVLYETRARKKQERSNQNPATERLGQFTSAAREPARRPESPHLHQPPGSRRPRTVRHRRVRQQQGHKLHRGSSCHRPRSRRPRRPPSDGDRQSPSAVRCGMVGFSNLQRAQTGSPSSATGIGHEDLSLGYRTPNDFTVQRFEENAAASPGDAPSRASALVRIINTLNGLLISEMTLRIESRSSSPGA